MEGIERILLLIDNSLNTEKRCHIAGGILISISLLFCGLAVTVLSVKPKTKEIDDSDELDLIYSEMEEN